VSYLLDTEPCIYWLNGREEIKRKVKEVGEDALNMAIITLGELRYGAYYSEKVDSNLKRINDFLSAAVKCQEKSDCKERFFFSCFCPEFPPKVGILLP